MAEMGKAAVEITDTYRGGLKKAALQYLPKALDSADGQKQVLETLAKVLPAFFPLDAKADFGIWRSLDSGECQLEEAILQIASEVEEIAGEFEEAAFLQSIAGFSEEELMIAWVHLDFYGYTLREQVNTNIVQLQDWIAQQLMAQGLTQFTLTAEEKLDQVQIQCYELQQKQPDSEELKTLKKQLGDGILEAKEIYVALDPLTNNRFPYVGMDGHMEIFTTQERAQNAMQAFAQQFDEKFNVAKIEQAGIKQFFEFAQNLGIRAMRVNNGFSMVELWFHEFFMVIDRGITEIRGKSIRNLMLRELQASARMDAAEDAEKAQQRYIESMMTMRANVYREFGSGLAYVFIPGEAAPGVTLYTKNALELARQLIQQQKLSEDSLLAPGEHQFQVYEGPLNIRIAHKNEKKDLQSAFVCAFTDRRLAELARPKNSNPAQKDCVVLVTLDELMEQAEKCAGILVDMTLLGYEIPKDRFGNVRQMRQAPGFIMAKAEPAKSE